MSRFLVFLVLTASPLIAQTAGTPHLAFPTDGNWVNQQTELQNHARKILKSELSRRLGPTCDMRTLSKIDFGNCFIADAAITQRNYRAFAQALKGSLAVPVPNFDPEVYPAAKTFTAAEVAWRSYMEKTCDALGITEHSGTETGMDVTACQRSLTRQHMKDLGNIFLGPYDIYQ